jgi:RNase P protein component
MQILQKEAKNMRFLFGVTGKELDKAVERNDIINDIIENWKPNYNLFSITQLACRNKTKRQRVRRIVKRLIRLGVVYQYSPMLQKNLK